MKKLQILFATIFCFLASYSCNVLALEEKIEEITNSESITESEIDVSETQNETTIIEEKSDNDNDTANATKTNQLTEETVTESEEIKNLKIKQQLLKEEEIKAAKKNEDLNNKDLKQTILNDKENVSSLNMVEQVEKNLLYNKENKIKTSNEVLTINHGGWSTEELENENKEKNLDISITTSDKDERNVTISRQAYNATTIGQLEISVKLYKNILEKDKNNSYALLGLATAYQQLGQYRQAKPIYKKLLNMHPGDESIIANLLGIVTEESPYEATYLLSTLSSKNPSSPLIHAQTSLAYSNLGEYGKAIEYLKKAIALDETNIQYKYNLAVLFDIKKDYTQAYYSYKSLLNYTLENDLTNQIPVKDIENRIRTITNKNI